MTVTTPTREPDSFVQGDTVTWTRSLPDFPASTWTLSYAFVTSSDQQTVTASASGDTHSVTISTDESALFAVGTYKYQAYVTSGSTRYTLDGKGNRPCINGRVDVIADFATNTTGYDARTHSEIVLADLKSAYQSYLSDQAKVASYSIGDRSITFKSESEFIEAISRAEYQVQQEIAAERLAKGLGHKGRIRVRF